MLQQGASGLAFQEESRRALPPEGWEGEVVEGEAVYVNVRQYHAIMRRRRQRAKAEAENKVLRVRKVRTNPQISRNFGAWYGGYLCMWGSFRDTRRG